MLDSATALDELEHAHALASFPPLRIESLREAAYAIGPMERPSTLLARFGHAPDGEPLHDRPGAYGVVVTDEWRVAVVRTEGHLVLPGGGVDAGESLEEALRRELREEAGLEVEVLGGMGAAGQVAHFAGRWWLKHCHFYLCRPGALGGAVEPDHELLWLDATAALDGLFYPVDRWALARAFRPC